MDKLPPLRLGVAGTPEFAVPALQRLALIRNVCAVFTQPDRPAGRGQVLYPSPVKRRALELGLAVYQPVTFKVPEAASLLRSLQLDLLVVAAYGLILPAAVLEIPRLGCINIHASLLPRWRGAAPIQRALLAGDSSTGITIMRMQAGLDTGPMLASRGTAITALDSAGSLHDRLAAIGADLMVETLPGIESATLRETPQPEEGVTYAQKINKAEARIDWSLDAAQVWRQVRAFNPWPVAETRWDGQQLRLWEAQLPAVDARPDATQRPDATAPSVAHVPPAAAPGSVLAASPQGIDVACGQGILRILRLQLAGRKPLRAGDFLKGQRLEGARFDPP
jgi:methionyl-tRNA formyltransferase